MCVSRDEYMTYNVTDANKSLERILIVQSHKPARRSTRVNKKRNVSRAGYNRTMVGATAVTKSRGSCNDITVHGLFARRYGEIGIEACRSHRVPLGNGCTSG